MLSLIICLYGLYFLLIFVLVRIIIRYIYRTLLFRKQLKENLNLRKLINFASKVNIDIIANFDYNYSGFVCDIRRKNQNHSLIKEPFIILGLKDNQDIELTTISLAHEIGHYLFYKYQIKKYKIYNSPELFCPTQKKRCALIEEAKAWQYAPKIISDSKISINENNFWKIASLYFGTYVISKEYNCFQKNCPKFNKISSTKVVKALSSINQEELTQLINYVNGLVETIRPQEVGKIFND